ncbi:MAG: hypothetical protein QXI16_03990 [Sulfolobaceae archaeon]
MKKKVKKIIYRIIVIVLSAVLMLPVNAINTNSTVKKAKASGLEAGIVTLEMLLMYLLSMVAQNNGVNIPFPKTKNQRTEYIKWYWQNADKLNAILDDKNYSYIEYEEGGITYKVPVTFAEIYENWQYIDLDRVVIEDNSLEIDLMIMSEATELIAEYYDVPALSSVKPINSPLGNKTNIKGVLQKNNVLLAESVYDNLESEGMFSYPYINVIKKLNRGVQDYVRMLQGPDWKMNAIIIIASRYPFIYNKSINYSYVGNNEVRQDNEIKLARIQWNRNSGKWEYTIPLLPIWELDGGMAKAYDDGYVVDFNGNDLYDISENVLYTTFNVYYESPTAYTYGGYLSKYEGQMKQSSLSYRTFLESKYGPLIRSDDGVIVINIDNWAEYDTARITWDIDNIANTDEAIDKLKVIDEEAGRYGDDVISPEIVLMEDYISEVDLAKYQAVIEVQGDIQSDFSNTYTDVIPTDVDIPENILNGLMFVAFVFGEMWAHLGSYSFVLVFSATIGAIAILIGLGKQVNDRGSASSKPNKKSKKGG